MFHYYVIPDKEIFAFFGEHSAEWANTVTRFEDYAYLAGGTKTPTQKEALNAFFLEGVKHCVVDPIDLVCVVDGCSDKQQISWLQELLPQIEHHFTDIGTVINFTDDLPNAARRELVATHLDLIVKHISLLDHLHDFAVLLDSDQFGLLCQALFKSQKSLRSYVKIHHGISARMGIHQFLLDGRFKKSYTDRQQKVSILINQLASQLEHTLDNKQTMLRDIEELSYADLTLAKTYLLNYGSIITSKYTLSFADVCQVFQAINQSTHAKETIGLTREVNELWYQATKNIILTTLKRDSFDYPGKQARWCYYQDLQLLLTSTNDEISETVLGQQTTEALKQLSSIENLHALLTNLPEASREQVYRQVLPVLGDLKVDKTLSHYVDLIRLVPSYLNASLFQALLPQLVTAYWQANREQIVELLLNLNGFQVEQLIKQLTPCFHWYQQLFTANANNGYALLNANCKQLLISSFIDDLKNPKWQQCLITLLQESKEPMKTDLWRAFIQQFDAIFPTANVAYRLLKEVASPCQQILIEQLPADKLVSLYPAVMKVNDDDDVSCLSKRVNEVIDRAVQHLTNTIPLPPQSVFSQPKKDEEGHESKSLYITQYKKRLTLDISNNRTGRLKSAFQQSLTACHCYGDDTVFPELYTKADNLEASDHFLQRTMPKKARLSKLLKPVVSENYWTEVAKQYNQETTQENTTPDDDDSFDKYYVL